MLEFQLDREDMAHITVDGRATFEDFQSCMPEAVQELASKHVDKLLLEVKSFDAPEDYVDPGLAFSTLNTIKSFISKLAVVCPPEASTEVEDLVRVVRNAGRPVKFFPTVGEARLWLSKS